MIDELRICGKLWLFNYESVANRCFELRRSSCVTKDSTRVSKYICTACCTCEQYTTRICAVSPVTKRQRRQWTIIELSCCNTTGNCYNTPARFLLSARCRKLKPRPATLQRTYDTHNTDREHQHEQLLSAACCWQNTHTHFTHTCCVYPQVLATFQPPETASTFAIDHSISPRLYFNSIPQEP